MSNTITITTTQLQVNEAKQWMVRLAQNQTLRIKCAIMQIATSNDDGERFLNHASESTKSILKKLKVI